MSCYFESSPPPCLSSSTGKVMRLPAKDSLMAWKVSQENCSSSLYKKVISTQPKPGSLTSYVTTFLMFVLKKSMYSLFEVCLDNKLIRMRRFQNHQCDNDRCPAPFLPTSSHSAPGQSDLHAKWPKITLLLHLRTRHLWGAQILLVPMSEGF